MEYVRLKDIGRIITGNTPPTSKPEYYGDYMPFIKATDISLGTKRTLVTEQMYSELAAEKYNESLVPKGSTCVVTIGSIGKKMTYAHTDLFVNQAINAIIPKDSYDNEYVFYNVKYSVLPQLKKLDSGTTSGRENVSKSSFSSIRIPVIKDKRVQHRIASILSTYDTLIENNTKRICLLEKMAENLYKEWFVRFRFPGHEKVEMENGLSKGWSIIKIKELSNVKSGFAFKSEWFTDAGCRVAKIKDIGGVLMDTSDLSYVSEDNCKKAEKFILREGDLTIALTGATIGKISIVPKHRGLIYTNQRLGKFFNGDNPIENLPFLYCLFAQDIMVQDIMNLANSSSAQPNISPEQIGNIKFKGNMDLIKRYNEVAKGFFQEILSLHEMNQNLARQRDLLLPRLMSGKLEV